jgi:hypothetical protein
MERGEDDATLLRLVTVVEHELRHGTTLTPRDPLDIRGTP